jgi:ABC-2 type transport system ATP-binding protein
MHRQGFCLMVVLEARQLVKRYPRVTAVDGVSLAITRGHCFGLLGPNGAGKTTSVEMLEGISRPTAGEVLYKGRPLGKRFRTEAGIMFQFTALQDFITVRETLEMFRSFYDKPAPLEDLGAACALGDLLDRDTRRLSGGQRQRLLPAIALANDPDVLFLDEPTTGLDPQARRNFWELIGSIKARGKTIVLTTHYMEEAYVLCDEVAIMDHGKIIAQGSPQQLLAEHFDDVILQLPADEVRDLRSELPAAVLRSQDTVELSTADVTDTIRKLLAMGISLSRLRIRSRNLEDLFLELTGRELRP